MHEEVILLLRILFMGDDILAGAYCGVNGKTDGRFAFMLGKTIKPCAVVTTCGKLILLHECIKLGLHLFTRESIGRCFGGHLLCLRSGRMRHRCFVFVLPFIGNR